MKNNIFAAKSSRTRIFAVITALGIVLALALNLLLAYIGLNKTVFIDMTYEGFYTLTDKMQEHCAFVDEKLDKPVEITFCADPDALMDSTVMRTTYIMALKLSQKFKNINVNTVNVALNPTAVAQYKTTSLSKITSADIIISYGDKYRIATGESFWTTNQDELWSYNGEYKMTSIILSLTAINKPAAYFITDHGTTYYDPENSEHPDNLDAAALYDLLFDRGLEVKTLNVASVDKIPEDCVLLILNSPTEDFTYDKDAINSFGYVSDLEKIDRYLTKGNGSLMVTNDFSLRNPDGTKKELTNLHAFLREWGFELSDTKVKDENNSLPSSDAFAPIIGVYDTEENSYGNAIYENYASSATSPKMIFTNTGYITSAFGLGEDTVEPGADNVNRHFAPFISTSSEALAYAYNKDAADSNKYTDLAGLKSERILAAICSRHYTHQYDSTITYSYVFCANSKDFLSNELLGNASYANFDIVSALINNMVRTDMHASTDLGGISLNSTSFGGKQIIDATLYDYETTIYNSDSTNLVELKVNSAIDSTDKTVISVFVFAIPVIIAAVGIAICLRRKFL